MQIKNTKGKKRLARNLTGLGVFLILAFLGYNFFSDVIFGSSGFNIGLGGSGDNKNNKDQESAWIDPFSQEGEYPIMIMLDSSPEARVYHSGLFEAEVVYEALVEGGATRLMALYSGAPSSQIIGPIRSARPYFVEIAAGWEAFYWHAGGSPEGLELIKKVDVIDLNEISGLGPIYFWRDKNIARPHNLFTDSNSIKMALADFELGAIPTEKLIWQWEDEDLSSLNFPLAGNVYIDFSEGVVYDSAYIYNQEDGLYYRDYGGGAHIDKEIGRQITTANIIIQKIPQEKYYPSGLGRLNLNVTGEGEALFFRDGVVIEGSWRKTDQNSQTQWLDTEGNVYKLKPGNTWVEIVPGDRQVNFQ